MRVHEVERHRKSRLHNMREGQSIDIEDTCWKDSVQR